MVPSSSVSFAIPLSLASLPLGLPQGRLSTFLSLNTLSLPLPLGLGTSRAKVTLSLTVALCTGSASAVLDTVDRARFHMLLFGAYVVARLFAHRA